MDHRTIILVAAAGLLIGVPARADGTPPGPANPKAAVHAALGDGADEPRNPPVLPDQASDRARFVHENIAFGRHGDAERAAHSQAGLHGDHDGASSHADVANRSAQGAAASAAGAANANAHAAAGQSRATAARAAHGAAGNPGRGNHGRP